MNVGSVKKKKSVKEEAELEGEIIVHESLGPMLNNKKS